MLKNKWLETGNEEEQPPGPHSFSSSLRLGVRRATPLAVSSGLFGILYGAACTALGVSPALAALACVLVFSGAVQFAVLGMLSDPVSYAAIAVSSLLICNRLLLMGVSIAQHLRSRPFPVRLFSMFVLTDGAWAATIAEKEQVDRFAFYVTAGLWILLLWVLGTLFGAIVAANLESEVISAFRFAGVLFLVLLLLLVVRNASMGHLPWSAAALTSLGASFLLPLPAAFLIGVSLGASIAWFRGAGEGDDDN